MRWITLLAIIAVIAFGYASATGEDAFQLDEVELSLLDPPVVLDPVDGSRWWYTPSRKAHFYRHRYPKPTGNEVRQGEDLRLPGDILPRSYFIRLLPFIEVGNWTTNGYVEIIIEPVSSTLNITMNALDLTIDSSSIIVTVLCAREKMNCLSFLLEGGGYRDWEPGRVGQLYRRARNPRNSDYSSFTPSNGGTAIQSQHVLRFDPQQPACRVLPLFIRWEWRDKVKLSLNFAKGFNWKKKLIR